MTEAVVATYRDVTTIRNVEDDLRAIGIPIEKIRIDQDSHRIRVMTPESTKPEILEILNRHQPLEVH